MKKQIADYLWNKAPSHLKDNQPKEEKDSYKLFEIWANRGYEVREAQKQTRLNRFPQTATPQALYMIAKERGIEKFDFETETEFRNRVINALDWHSLKGTVKGIKTILQIYGFEDIKVSPVKDKTRWAEFEIEIKQESLLQRDIDKFQKVYILIKKIKPTHEKLSELKVSLRKSVDSTIYTGTFFNTGKKYNVYLHINPQIKNINIYTGSSIRYAKKQNIGINTSLINAENINIYTSSIIRYAKTIKIGVA